MNVILLESRLWLNAQKNGVSRESIEQKVRDAASEAAKLLPNTFTYTNILVYPTTGDKVIPETGDAGFTTSDEYISITFDAEVPHGDQALMSSIRGTVFHELVHATTFAHDPWQPAVIFGAVTEGLATVFERDHARKPVPWGKYDADEIMLKWYRELKSITADDTKNIEYFYTHPDGRRWIAYKTGTWMIDKLLAHDEDIFALMQLPHDDIVRKFEALT